MFLELPCDLHTQMTLLKTVPVTEQSPLCAILTPKVIYDSHISILWKRLDTQGTWLH